MVANQPILTRVREIAGDVADTAGLEFVHAEIAGAKRDSVVRIFIDKEGGVTFEDCTSFSAAVEAVFDEEDLIPWAYVLEVSSPGIERQLYSLKDFVRFTGEMARIKTVEEIGGQKNFVGTIESIDGDIVSFEDRTSGPVKIPHSLVSKANLKMDFGKELKGGSKD